LSSRSVLVRADSVMAAAHASYVPGDASPLPGMGLIGVMT
jgi:hypothetical protein